MISLFVGLAIALAVYLVASYGISTEGWSKSTR